MPVLLEKIKEMDLPEILRRISVERQDLEAAQREEERATAWRIRIQDGLQELEREARKRVREYEGERVVLDGHLLSVEVMHHGQERLKSEPITILK